MPEVLASLIDPFAEDIVTDPRRVDYSVPGLNDAALNVVKGRVQALRASAGGDGKGPAAPVKALVVSASRAGAGKSHLVGRLFRALSGEATLVNIRPFVDPESCWKSVLMRLVQELNFPDRFSAADGESPTQLELFAHVTLARIVADHLAARGGNARTVEILRRPPPDLVKLKRDKKWCGALRTLFDDKQRIDDIQARLRRCGLNLQAPPETWMRILYGYTYSDDASATQACLDWIQADPIDEDAAATLGLRAAVLPGAEQGAGMENALAKARVMDLCQLAVFFRPFLFCFDQTENYGRTPELARTLGTVIADFSNEAMNQLTLITLNVEPWEKRLKPHWEVADHDRLDPRTLVLEGVGPAQGRALAEHRLALFDIEPDDVERFCGDEQWLEGMFVDQAQMPVREFLHECSKRWHACMAQSPPEPTPPLDDLFARYIDKVSAQPRRLVFDRDALFWAVTELAAGLEGVRVDCVSSRRRTNVPRWRHAGRSYLFGLEAGNHWKTWLGIATFARAAEEAGEDRVSVCLRTPELARIPKSSWKSADDILRAMQSRLLLLRLDRHRMITLYAAHDLYVDAVQGDIDYEPDLVKAFLRGQLAEFWQRILGWRGDAMPDVGGQGNGGPGSGQGDDGAHPPAAPPARGPSPGTADSSATDHSALIEASFAAFKLEVSVVGKIEAPQLLRYQVRPGPGVKVVSLVNRAQDLQVALTLPMPPRIEPSQGFVTIDIPKEKQDTVSWREAMEDEDFMSHPSRVAFPVGKDVGGRMIICDFADPNTCHALVGGTSGSGKSEFLKALVASLIARNTPRTLRLALIDPKILTFGELKDSLHLLRPIIGNLEGALACLEEAVEDMERRYALLADAGVANLAQYIQVGHEDTPYHVLIFDEFADLVLAGKDERRRFETLVSRLAAKGRAAGIHLVLATQRPDRNIVTGPIKANLPLRICLKVTNAVNSQIILDEPGGEALVGRGDLLCDRGKGSERAQAPFVEAGALEGVREGNGDGGN